LNLFKNSYPGSRITRERVLQEDSLYTSYLVTFFSQGKTVSGQINIPVGEGPFPVIVMLRGYVDQEIYTTGMGTQRAAEYFAKNGFITFAPDFLGYGDSDKPSENILEERFQTYVVALDAIASVKNIDKADPEKIGLWGHSNGGQIALTILEASGVGYPAVLWAPVSKPFPYSILYYSDELSDRGKLLRKKLAEFEQDYDVDLYSLTNYLELINAPIELHQGTLDDAVPQSWSKQLVDELGKQDKQIDYFIYPGADHNLMPSWNLAVERSWKFFRDKL
jgi:dipeptidyl aminopeptidase/acylaminoacyl peptidase